MMRVITDSDRGPMLRVFGKDGEIAYAILALRGPRLEFETPSTWHEHRRAWLRVCLGFVTFAVSIPWRWVVADKGQCSGPRYGFAFFGDALWIYYGNDDGTRAGSHYRAIYLPWAWEHVRHDYLRPDGSLHHLAGSEEYAGPDDTKQVHGYRYSLRSGEVQERSATINGEEREWRWRWFQWLPWPNKVQRTINIEFSDEVGEGTGSWKGGTIGCSYDWRRGESMEQALRRMERDRKFSR